MRSTQRSDEWNNDRIDVRRIDSDSRHDVCTKMREKKMRKKNNKEDNSPVIIGFSSMKLSLGDDDDSIIFVYFSIGD